MKNNFSRRQFLKTTGLGLSSLIFLGCKDKLIRNKPNIILILVDDLGWTDLGCYGSKYYETPNIDHLASQGIKFINGYAACAVCSPTRAAVMTGRYPARLGITDWIRARFQGGKIPENKQNPTQYVGGENRKLLCPPNPLWMELEEVTIAEILKNAGYTTCHIGKWHLGGDEWYPEKQGFDYNIGGCDYGQPPNYFDPYFRKKQGVIPTLPPRKEGEYLTDREADEAVKFIQKHKAQPFFLYLANYAVHTPIQAKEKVTDKYKNKPATNQKNPKYAAMVESVDDCLGRIIQTLDEEKLAENTLIIFTGDNGGLLPVTDNRPLRSGKGYPYEGGIREPLIIRWPGKIKADIQSDEPVTSVDFFPTICEATGIKLPPDREIDGISLIPVLNQSDKLNRDALFWHFPHYRGKDVVPYSIIRSGDWKLIKRYQGKMYELFNLKSDLSETTDLSEKMPEKVRVLNTKLIQWLEDIGAKLPKKNPKYRGV
jgi:arylsulfatase A-like enzyme